MDGWMGGWMNCGSVDEWMDCGWMDGWVDGWMDRWVDGWVGEHMDDWMDEWTDGWVEAEDRSGYPECEGKRAQHSLVRARPVRFGGRPRNHVSFPITL